MNSLYTRYDINGLYLVKALHLTIIFVLVNRSYKAGFNYTIQAMFSESVPNFLFEHALKMIFACSYNTTEDYPVDLSNMNDIAHISISATK